MIYFSSYSNLKKNSEFYKSNNIKIYSIVLFPAKWQKFENINELAPGLNAFNEYKKDADQDKFIQNYIKKIKKIITPELIQNYDNSCFVCFCPPDGFCHRHILKYYINIVSEIETREVI